MELPNKARAYIPVGKILDYLLSENHAVGKSKAKFFRSLGFDEEKTNLLEAGLLNLAFENDIREATETPYGTKYVIDGILKNPKSVMIQVRTVWIIEINKPEPRFVTAYPLE